MQEGDQFEAGSCSISRLLSSKAKGNPSNHLIQGVAKRISDWKLCTLHTTSTKVKHSFLKDLLDFEPPSTQGSTLHWDCSDSGLSPSLNSSAVTANGFCHRTECHQKSFQVGAYKPDPGHFLDQCKNS